MVEGSGGGPVPFSLCEGKSAIGCEGSGRGDVGETGVSAGSGNMNVVQTGTPLDAHTWLFKDFPSRIQDVLYERRDAIERMKTGCVAGWLYAFKTSPTLGFSWAMWCFTPWSSGRRDLEHVPGRGRRSGGGGG